MNIPSSDWVMSIPKKHSINPKLVILNILIDCRVDEISTYGENECIVSTLRLDV